MTAEYRKNTKQAPSPLNVPSVRIKYRVTWQHAENGKRTQENNRNPKSQTMLTPVPKEDRERQCDRCDDELIAPSSVAHDRRIGDE
ncbi:MAG: hypothetical protein IT579_23285 [Verrucomicrobia subdivision 3 bacterium]|nr:hypothetical protein [Limisphaerales bacterium]